MRKFSDSALSRSSIFIMAHGRYHLDKPEPQTLAELEIFSLLSALNIDFDERLEIPSTCLGNKKFPKRWRKNLVMLILVWFKLDFSSNESIFRWLKRPFILEISNDTSWSWRVEENYRDGITPCHRLSITSLALPSRWRDDDVTRSRRGWTLQTKEFKKIEIQITQLSSFQH